MEANAARLFAAADARAEQDLIRLRQAEAARLVAQHRQADAEAEQPTAAGPLTDAAILDWLELHGVSIQLRAPPWRDPIACDRDSIRAAMHVAANERKTP